MPLRVGIDEAGYGPQLGPLVSAASVWRVGEADVASNLWTKLKAVLKRPPVTRDSQLPVGDSKQVFDRKKGIASLERPVLAFGAALGLPTDRLDALLNAITSDPRRFDGAPPWYAALDQPLPLDPQRSQFAAIAQRLASTMASREVTCVGLLAEVVSEQRFNERIRQTDNKAEILLEHVLRLIDRISRKARGETVHLTVDRLGGRANYTQALLRAFPARRLHVIETSPGCSRYRLESPGQGDWHVRFVVDADQDELPVALASMVAKYVREALMARFNAWWQALQPDLRPTAGYYNDAQRFLKDIAPILPQSGLDPAQFVRLR